METKKILTQAEEVILDYVLSTILDNIREVDEDVYFTDGLICLTDFDMEIAKGQLQKIKQ